MNREIRKYRFEISPEIEISLPLDSRILFVEKQKVSWLDDGLERKEAWATFLWCEIDPEITRDSIRHFKAVKDNEPYDSRGLSYIGSLELEGQLFHFLEIMIYNGPGTKERGL